MPSEGPALRSQSEIERRIERQIVQRTLGRVHGLRVEVDGGCVAVYGCTPSYHVKQLALQAVLDSMQGACVELDVQVGTHERRTRVSP